MSFEDTIRVADLKTRPDRVARVIAEASPERGEIVEIAEFLKPRVEELCGTLPAALGRWLLGARTARRILNRLCRGRRIATTSIGGLMVLRTVATLRHWRRGTLRFVEEDRMICEWLAQIRRVAPSDVGLARELVACQDLVRGYGETHDRGWEAFSSIMQVSRKLERSTDAGSYVKSLREAALADEEGKAFRERLAVIVETLSHAPSSIDGQE
jgi:indolepyruvate ferredoxin oxidoreductase beta subunit